MRTLETSITRRHTHTATNGTNATLRGTGSHSSTPAALARAPGITTPRWLRACGHHIEHVVDAVIFSIGLVTLHSAFKQHHHEHVDSCTYGVMTKRIKVKPLICTHPQPYMCTLVTTAQSLLDSHPLPIHHSHTNNNRKPRPQLLRNRTRHGWPIGKGSFLSLPRSDNPRCLRRV